MRSIINLDSINKSLSGLTESIKNAQKQSNQISDNVEKRNKVKRDGLTMSSKLFARRRDNNRRREKEDLLNTENKLLDVEKNSSNELRMSKAELNKLQNQLDMMLDKIEDDIDNDKKLSKESFKELKLLVKKITLSQEEYAEKYGKNKSIESDSIKRKERIKNIDVELENWGNLKSNSEKMSSELSDRKIKLLSELSENDKIDARIVTNKKFHVPEDYRNLILVSNGTGIAPFIGIANENKSKANIELFWGGKSADDYNLYKSEIQHLQSEQKLNQVFTIYSEDKKQYVQKLISDNDKIICNALENGDAIMICGSIAMGKAVLNEINSICKSHGLKKLDFYKDNGQIKMDCY